MLFYLSNDEFFPNVRHIGFSKFLKDWVHFTRTCDEYIIYLVIDGDLFIKENEQEFHLSEGDFLVLEPGKTHTGYQASKCKYYYFHFNNKPLIQKIEKENTNQLNALIDARKNSLNSDPFLPNEFPNTMNIIFPKRFTIKNKNTLINISSITYSAIEDYYRKYENYKLFVSSIVLQILITVSREYITSLFESNSSIDGSSKVHMTLNKLIDYIENNYQLKINTSTIEEYMELNYDYLNELLKKHYKVTIGKFIQNVRINAAKKLIQETDLNFSEIAYLVGVNDPYYFSKLFKNFTGYTPSKYSNIIKAEQLT